MLILFKVLKMNLNDYLIFVILSIKNRCKFVFFVGKVDNNYCDSFFIIFLEINSFIVKDLICIFSCNCIYGFII